MHGLPTERVREGIISDFLEKYDFLNHGIIGKSLCGRNIDFLRLGSNSKMVLWAGAFHGMEWLTSLVLLKFIKKVCEEIKNERKILGVDLAQKLNERGLMVIPCVNPDGVEISLTGSGGACKYKEIVDFVSKGNTSSWQANTRGVDLNHNYDAGWNELRLLEQKSGIIGPAPTRYGGLYPESEPETAAITKLCRENNFNHAIAFHSQGEEIYWKYGMNTPKCSEALATIFAFSSGYELSSPEGLAVGGGFKDWFITEFNKPAFTVEIGKGENPLPLSDLDSVYNKLENMLFISAFVEIN